MSSHGSSGQQTSQVKKEVSLRPPGEVGALLPSGARGEHVWHLHELAFLPNFDGMWTSTAAVG